MSRGVKFLTLFNLHRARHSIFTTTPQLHEHNTTQHTTMRLCHPFLVLLLADVASSNAVSAPTANELSKLTSPGLDQDAKMDIDGHRMLRARDEIADATGEESRSAPSDVRKLSSSDENVVKLAETLKNQLHLDHSIKRFNSAEQFTLNENPSFNIGKAEGASPKAPTKKQQKK